MGRPPRDHLPEGARKMLSCGKPGSFNQQYLLLNLEIFQIL